MKCFLTGMSYDSSPIIIRCSAQDATIFSCVRHPPPPLMSVKLASTSSAPSMAQSNFKHKNTVHHSHCLLHMIQWITTVIKLTKQRYYQINHVLSFKKSISLSPADKWHYSSKAASVSIPYHTNKRKHSIHNSVPSNYKQIWGRCYESMCQTYCLT